MKSESSISIAWKACTEEKQNTASDALHNTFTLLTCCTKESKYKVMAKSTC